MKILFIMTTPIVAPSNGILSQMKTWRYALASRGHDVDFYNPCTPPDWNNYDVIHFFSFSEYLSDFIDVVYPINSNIVVSPILDTTYSVKQIKFLSLWGSSKLRLTNKYFNIKKRNGKIKKILARSNFEKEYFLRAWGFDENKIDIVPLSYGMMEPFECDHSKRENYCFHLSLLADERKNVRRLIEASKKFNFQLKLAGKLRNEMELAKLKEWMRGNPNVEYLGFLEKDQLLYHYRHAKVFALPSINEGVGLVGLEAAMNGCDIVITNWGGPQEYYGSLALKVNPYDVNSIGKAVIFFLSTNTFQPKLSSHIVENYSLERTIAMLEQCYREVCTEKGAL